MKDYRYLAKPLTLAYDREACVGCGLCATVCPQRVFRLEAGKAVLEDRDGCMECGACTLNCPTQAVTVTPGVGCAPYIINSWLGRDTGCCC